MNLPEAALEDVFRREHGLVLASLVKTFGDFDLAEDALADAVAAALETWPDTDIPDNPAAWLLTVGRRKGIDRVRRAKVLSEKLEILGRDAAPPLDDDGGVPDERLRLIFACCHPALSPEARVALTLKSLGGLTTAEVARAFLTSEATMFQRITRAKRKIRLAGIPVEMPSVSDLPDRLDTVLTVIYLIFNEGYSPITGEGLVRIDLCGEAMRLAEMMTDLMPEESEVWGLAALFWLTDARRNARVDGDGNLVLLEDQDRLLWDADAIERGLRHLEQGTRLGHTGPFLIQASIAGIHARASGVPDTAWDRIIALYLTLFELKPSPVVALNLAAATAMMRGPEAGLDLMEDLGEVLDNYQPFHASRAELLFRAGRGTEAAAAFERALDFPLNDVERRHLEGRLNLCVSGNAGVSAE